VHTYAPTFDAVFNEILLPTCGIAFCHNEPGAYLDASSPGAAYATLVGALSDTPTCGHLGMVRVEPGDPDRSLLYLKLTTPPCGRRMPLLFDDTLDPREVEQVRRWIERGALREEPMGAADSGAAVEAGLRDASSDRGGDG